MILKQSEKLENQIHELTQARREADQANQAKSEFLAKMSHELRTPLNAILGFAQVLINHPRETLNPNQKESIGEIRKAGNHLLVLIDEILDLSKIESREMILSLEPVELGSLVEEIFVLVRPLADEMNVQLLDEISFEKHFVVLTDRTRLKQVLMNLISNGIKYNRRNGTLQVYNEPSPNGKVNIHIKDSGMGISENLQSRLFIPFDRLGKEKTEINGTGIGLTITKTLVELMGGNIKVTSREGEGTCFTVELPKGEITANVEQNTGSLSDNSSPAKANLERFKLLYVEDNPANLRLVKAIFSTQNEIRLISAGDAGLGIELARTHKPDLILMDINLPGMDGIEAVKKLQIQKETQAIPVIAISANAMQNDIDHALASGFKQYLTKPIDVDQLLAVVKLELGIKNFP
jgi:CheY-like chemotaxis protein